MSHREFSRLEYRRQVAWPERLRREGPFLEGLLREIPDRGSIVDVGCGTGEHTRHLALRGFPAIGIDRSREAVIAAARLPCEGNVSWIRGDARRLPLAAGIARLVLCLGNTLVILEEDDAIARALREANRLLVPGGALVVQILNYHRLRSAGQRHLPLNFRPVDGGAGELVYLRLLDFEEPEHVAFHVVTLERRLDGDVVLVRDSVRRRLRSLPYDRLVGLAGAAGLTEIRLLGDYGGTPFRPEESSDAILTARRP